MEAPDRHEQAPPAVDLDKQEGDPTPHASLEINLQESVRVAGNAALPAPVMLVLIGALAAVAVVIAALFFGQASPQPTAMLAAAVIFALVVNTTTGFLAWYSLKHGACRQAKGKKGE